MKYDFQPGAEFAWLALAAASGGLSVAIAQAAGADATLTGAIGVFVTAAFRAVLGFFIPQPSE